MNLNESNIVSDVRNQDCFFFPPHAREEKRPSRIRIGLEKTEWSFFRLMMLFEVVE